MKKSFALDSRLFLFILCISFTALMTLMGWQDGDKGFAVFGGILTAVFILGLIISPKIYIADEEGLSIYYLPFVKEYLSSPQNSVLPMIYCTGRPAESCSATSPNSISMISLGSIRNFISLSPLNAAATIRAMRSCSCREYRCSMQAARCETISARVALISYARSLRSAKAIANAASATTAARRVIHTS